MDINSHQVCGTRSAGSSKHCGDYVLRAAPKHKEINMSKDGGFFSWGPRKDYCFPIKNGGFLEDWNGSPLKNLPTCCFTMKVSHYRCAISQDCSPPVGSGSHHRTGASLCIAGNALAKATVHGWVVMVPAGLEGRNAGTALGQAQRKQTWGMLYSSTSPVCLW